MQTLVREIHSLEEAFSYLAPEVRNHSRRVAEYAEALFVQVVSEELYEGNPKGAREFKEENRKLAYEAGMYHDIGKAYFPEPYQTNAANLMEEEVAVYRQHVENGVLLLPQIVKGFNGRKDLEKRMVLDGIRDHHERVDEMCIRDRYYTINAAKAKETAGMLQPRVTIPMHYRSGGYGFDVIGTLDEDTGLCDDIVCYNTNILTVTEDTKKQTAVLGL